MNNGFNVTVSSSPIVTSAPSSSYLIDELVEKYLNNDPSLFAENSSHKIDDISPEEKICEMPSPTREELMFLKPRDVENGLYININDLANYLTNNEIGGKDIDEDSRNEIFDKYQDIIMKFEIK